MKKGDELVLDVTALSSEGKGISRTEEGFVIFTEKTLPGDRIKVKIRKKKSGYAEAKLAELIEPSSHRIAPPCDYFGVCGGCKIQNLEYEEQLKFKTESVKNALSKIGGFKDIEVPAALASDNIFFYRNKMEFSFSDDKWLDEAPAKTPLTSPLSGGIEGGETSGDKLLSGKEELSSDFKTPLSSPKIIPPDPPLKGGDEVGKKEQVEPFQQKEKNTNNFYSQEEKELTPFNPPSKGGQGGSDFVFEESWLKKRGLILTYKHLPYNPNLLDVVRQLRKNQTPAEIRLWNYIKDLGIRILRQRPIDHFIAGFYCPTAKLVIEIDGEYHLQEDYKIRDEERSRILLEVYKLEVIRFSNKQVMNDIDEVIRIIKRRIKERLSPPTPPLEGGALESASSYPFSKGGQGESTHKENKNPEDLKTHFEETESGSSKLSSKECFSLGLHVPRFHSKIVDIHKCWLQSEISNGILNFTRDFFKSRDISIYSTSTHTGYLRFLIIRQSANTNDLMVDLMTNEYDENLIKEYCGQLLNLFPQITTFVNGITSKKAQVAFGEQEHILYGTGSITEKLITSSWDEYSFKISPNSFFQTNTKQAEKLFNIASDFGEFNKADNVLDLYCGAGSISLFISGKVNEVLGVELVEDAINNANENKKLNNINNAEFILSDIKDFLESTSIKEYNKIILDPPRAGLHPAICEILSETEMDRIIYVSCNPSTQARDLAIICGKGKYVIEKVQPVDMFPHTFHVENVISLIKA